MEFNNKNEAVENSNNKEEFVETPQSETAKSRKKRFILLGIIGIIGLCVCVYYYIHSITYISTDDAYIEGHLVPISPKVSGNVIKVYVDDNQTVKKGELLAEIDSRDYKVQYDQALARLEAAIEKQKSANINVDLTSVISQADEQQANSGVGVAKSAIDIADKQILQAKANFEGANQDVNSAKADFNLAQIEFDRNESLFKKGGVSKKDLDKASANLKTTSAKLNSFIEKVSSAKANLQSAYANREASVKSLNISLGKFKGANTVKEKVAMSHSASKIAIAEIKQLKAAAEQAKLNLSYTKIYAPQSGNITGKNVEDGVYVQTGQPLLVIVPERRWIVANFKETQLTDMKVGQPVSIKVDAYPHKKFKGRVDSIQSSTGAKASLFPPENAVGSFVKVVQRVPVKITFTENDSSKFSIVPGMSVVPEVKVK